MSVPSPEEYLDRLQRRADHLAFRIANSDKDLSFDKAELSAILWAIRELRGMRDVQHAKPRRRSA
jgi:hypothetical protein